MNENSIGIILSKRLWDSILLKKTIQIEGTVADLLSKRGEELKLSVLFFNIEEIHVKERKGKAFMVQNSAIIDLGNQDIPSIVYNPNHYHQRSHKRTIFQLSRQENCTVINERAKLRNKHLLELISSNEDIKNLVPVSNEPIHSPIIFTILGQKKSRGTWHFPFFYAKDFNGQLQSYEEAWHLLPQMQMDQEQLKEKIHDASNIILKLIQFYYPGIYELGLRFFLNKKGDIKILSTVSIEKVLKDAASWDPIKYEELVSWPIELSSKLLESSVDPEMKREKLISLPECEEADHRSGELRLHEGTLRPLWVKLTVFQDSEPVLKFPSSIAAWLKKLPEVMKYGVKEEDCRSYLFEEDSGASNKNSYHQPHELFISNSLAETLRIPADLIFQIQVVQEKVILGPTVGLLLGEKNHLYNLSYMKKFTNRLGAYKRFGGVVFAFSTRSIDWDRKVAYGMMYDPIDNCWRYASTTIPAAIYRRNFHQNKTHLQKLVEMTDNQVFNSYHFKKSDLYLLKNEPIIEKYLPDTFLLEDPKELMELLVEKKKVILKPVSLSRGRGIFILEAAEKGHGFILTDYNFSPKVHHHIKDLQEFEGILKKLNVIHNGYLYQTYIPLLKVHNRSFDVRVVMQKYNRNRWLCTGIECRVAGENEELTNIARGGNAMTLEEAIKKTKKGLSFRQVHRSILNLSHKFCDLMDQGNEHFAEFGIDVALDEQGYPWLLEANIFPSFKGFKTLDYDTFLRIRFQPLFYAVQIQGFKIDDFMPVERKIDGKKIYF